MKKSLLILIPLVVIVALIIWRRMPIIGDDLSRQTLYVGFIDTCYGLSEDDKAYAMWIDDDSYEGVFTVKRIADDLGIKPSFAVIADRMTTQVADSLATWQKQGAGIIVHGLRHERWNNWDETQIEQDIRFCYKRLMEQGFDSARILRLIIPPFGCNTSAIRKAIKREGSQMISGASLVNPDRHVFQLGRIVINPQTDISATHRLLKEAYERKAFVIFGTHSSMPDWFSEKKTKEILKIARDIGFDFNAF